MEGEIIDSVKNGLKRRLVSPLYGTFILTWAVLHWEFFYTALFVGEEKIWLSKGLLKSEYLRLKYFDWHNISFYIYFFLPFLLTYLIIWHFPKLLSIPAFKRDTEDETTKKEIELNAKKVREQKELEILNISTQRVKKEKEAKETKKEIEKIDPSSQWDTDYHLFKQSIFQNKFKMILTSIYNNSGNVKVYGNYNEIKFEIPQDILIYSHTNDLITLDRNNESIELTEKGRYFVKRISAENPFFFT